MTHHPSTTDFANLVTKVHNTPSDIWKHLNALKHFASKCNHVTEFGLRDGNSTVALILGCGLHVPRGTVVSYDVIRTGIVDTLLNTDIPCHWQFIHESTIDPTIKIEPTDFLLIDTIHTNEQVREELRLHADAVRRFIAWHDTACPNFDIADAIKEYLDKTPHRVVYESTENNGMLIIEKLKRKGTPDLHENLRCIIVA